MSGTASLFEKEVLSAWNSPCEHNLNPYIRRYFTTFLPLMI